LKIKRIKIDVCMKWNCMVTSVKTRVEENKAERLIFIKVLT
jgi:hypothetical protein